MPSSRPNSSPAPAAAGAAFPPNLDQLRRRLPVLMLRPLRWASPAAVALGLQLALGPVLQPGDLDFLCGRVLRVQVNDLGLRWNLTYRDGALRLLSPAAPADTCISGELREFMLLASRQEDPDTLFFQRRLVVEGDTELGLQVKNLLDSLDLDALAPPLRWCLRRLRPASA